MLTADLTRRVEEVLENGNLEDSFYFINEGVFKTVYGIPNTTAVLKVERKYSTRDHWDPPAERISMSFDLERAVYTMCHMTGSGHYFPETKFGFHRFYGNYMIQEKCTPASLDRSPPMGDICDLEQFAESVGISDMHDGNVGVACSSNRAVIIDWGWPNEDDRPGTLLADLQEKLEMGEPIFHSEWSPDLQLEMVLN